MLFANANANANEIIYNLEVVPWGKRKTHRIKKWSKPAFMTLGRATVRGEQICFSLYMKKTKSTF